MSPTRQLVPAPECLPFAPICARCKIRVRLLERTGLARAHPPAAASGCCAQRLLRRTRYPRAALQRRSGMSGAGRRPRRRLPRFDAPPPARAADLAPSFSLLSLSSTPSRHPQRDPTGSESRTKRPRSMSPQQQTTPTPAKGNTSEAKRVRRTPPADASHGLSEVSVPGRRSAAGPSAGSGGRLPDTTWLDVFEGRDSTAAQWKPLGQRVRRARQRRAPG